MLDPTYRCPSKIASDRKQKVKNITTFICQNKVPQSNTPIEEQCEEKEEGFFASWNKQGRE